ncbi:MAG: hypothetical protein Kow0069_04200 [Promethearchaeota archaeon]
MKNEPACVFRVTTNDRGLVWVLDAFSEMLNAIYPKFGVSVFFESILDGTVVFFETAEDFARFHELSKELPRVEPDERGEPATFRVKIEKLPAGYDMRENIHLVVEGYKRLSSDVDVTMVGDDEAEIRYANRRIFVVILERMKEVWGSLLDEKTNAGPA